MTDHVWISGVLWSGEHLFPKVVETIELLRSKGMSTRAWELSILDPRSYSNRQENGICHKQLDQVEVTVPEEAVVQGDP